MKNENNTNENRNNNLKSDLIDLSVVIFIIVAMLACLYYYDQQSDILKAVTGQITNLF